MEFRLLGAVEVLDGDTGEALAVPRKRERLLLAVLLLEAGRSISDERLTDLLWDGEPPPGAPGALRSHVSRLRALLPPEIASLDRQGEGYLLRTEPRRVDAHRFQALVRRAGSTPDAADRSELLGSALRLWRGPALADAASDLARARLCAGLEELRLQALDQRIAADLALGRHRDLVAELTDLVAEHPVKESLAAHLMRALHLCGRQADALRVFETARRAVADELGLDPGPELRAAHAHVLRSDQGLGAANPSAVPAQPEAVPPGEAAQAADGPRASSGPCTLPYDVPDFTGRAAEFARLLSCVADEAPAALVVSTVDGMAGVGKTTLAVHAAHHLAARFPGGQLFLDLHAHTAGRGPLEPAAALAGLLRTIGVPPERIPHSPDDRAAVWRDELRDRRVLLVLDNAATAEQVRLLLPGTAGSLVLVTSRRRLADLPGAATLSLDVLPEAEAVALFARVAGPGRTDDGPAEVAEVVALCGHLPLAIRMAAARLRHRPLWTVADLAGRLRRSERLAELAVGDQRVAAAFALSYDQLDVVQRRLFRLLGVCPGSDVDVFTAAALAGIPVAEAERLLESLLDVHLLTQRLPGRYAFHDLVRDYARSFADGEGDGDSTREAVHRLLDYHLHTTALAREAFAPGRLATEPKLTHPPLDVPELSGVPAVIDWCCAERANLLSSVRIAAAHGLPAHAWQITFNLADYLRVGGHHDESVAAHTAAIDAARGAGDRGAESLTLLNLGVAHWGADEPGAALDCGERALALVRELGDRRREIVTLTRVALFRQRLGDYPAALSGVQQALAAVQEVESPREEGVALWLLGHIRYMLGDFAGAVEASAGSLAIDRRIGDRYGIPLALIGIGAAEGKLGRHDEGHRHLQEALAAARQLNDPAIEAKALVELAEINRTRGRTDDALVFLGQVFDLLSAVTRPEPAGLAHLVAGAVHLDRGEPARALDHHGKALEIAAAIDHRCNQAFALDGIGRALAALGRADEAAAHWRRALDLFTRMGLPEADTVRELLESPAPPGPAVPVTPAGQSG
ncbi:tetratricopeptide repeat protein [Streptomyces sp. NBC_01351]|uniref:AfsR/SARP family transcriptional regulator n=1 Tax=Streptomyces sp. NBC_01351 TaxID=2903833 RepID=UPI002E35C1EC|nr:BTAD domain-containing putative transcriptional regulator [Streptomyces sp. NBC_01351]